MATKIDRKPPMHRQTVTVGVGRSRRDYEVVTNIHDPNYPVFVGSASQPGFWILLRCQGAFQCACPGFQWHGNCSHVKAAIAADTVLFAPDPWPGPSESQDFEAWLDQVASEIGNEPPDDDLPEMLPGDVPGYAYRLR